ncbi:MAG: SRPBCC family protein [Gemmatimonadota bacterium]
MITDPINPELDLVLERRVPVPPKVIWDAWTIPEQLMQWFTPRPWKTTECDIDLRPGGVFRTVMQSPDGEEFDNPGCYLVVEPGRRIVFTDALGPAYRPQPEPFMTAEILIEPEGSGTRYRAIARHADPAARAKHEEMGFAEGWGTALDQLLEFARSRAEM